jgi:hypothetical protein
MTIKEELTGELAKLLASDFMFLDKIYNAIKKVAIRDLNVHSLS